MPEVADRMDSIPFSGIRRMFEEVTRREKLGQKIIHLEIGRSDFDTPEHIKTAAWRALEKGQVHYSSNYGISELREAIAKKLRKENNLSYDPANEIIVTVGANEAVFITMMGLLNPGDEVLIPDPCWLHYFYCAQMAGAIPISVPLREERNFNPDLNDFRSRMTSRTRMIVVNTPNNPTGAIFTNDVLEGLAKLAREHDLFVISDEIYEKMVYEGNRHFSFGCLPGMRERTITINGFSKIYAMDGWRLGYVAADKRLVSALIRIRQYTTVCSTTFTQWGAVEALSGPQTEAYKMAQEFDRRRSLVYEALRAIPGISVVKPVGAFYIFPNIQSFGRTSEEMAEYLLDEAQIAVVPGTTLGEYGKGFIRISYANSYESLEIAMESMAAVLRKLKS